jgi:uncharacterized membrane protein
VARRDTPGMMYEHFDLVVRELGGGAWFWISGALGIAFTTYIVRFVQGVRRGRKPTREDKVAFGSACGLLVFSLGSTGRGFLNWMQFHYARQGFDPSVWVDLWPWFGTTILLNIVGGLIAVWFLTTWRYRTLFVVLTFLLAIGVPVAFYFDPR